MNCNAGDPIGSFTTLTDIPDDARVIVQLTGDVAAQAITGADFKAWIRGLFSSDSSPELSYDDATGVFSLSIPEGITGADNLGMGEEVFASESGGLLYFKTLAAGPGISLSSDANEITIEADITGAENLGSGEGIVSDIDPDGILQTKSLTVGEGLAISSDTDEILIELDGGGGGALIPLALKLYRTNKYYSATMVGRADLSDGGSLATGNAYWVPFVPHKTITLDRMGIYVSVAGNAGSYFELGVYTDSGNTPSALINSVTVTTDATGFRSAAFTGDAVVLNAGELYWFAVFTSFSSAPTVHFANVPTSGGTVIRGGYFELGSTSSTDQFVAFFRRLSLGALPDPAAPTHEVSGSPIPSFRVSAVA